MPTAFLPCIGLARHTARFALRAVPYPIHSSPTVYPSNRRVRILCTTAESPAPSPTKPSQIPVGKPLTSAQIRSAFLDFYASKGHTPLPSFSLVPDDPTIMLTIAGMVPFKPIFLGTSPPPQPPRATTSQKCIRTNDIENVGVTKRHHTFFEMLGNFSFGDYFKEQAIVWAWQLLTQVYGIPPQRLAISVYEDDDEALQIWRDVVGVEQSRIQRLGEKDNFWASGPTGPCGPCSEIYFDFDPLSDGNIDLEDDDRFIELYNLVFMQFSRDADGVLTPLKAQNIDTGMGLERMAQVLQQVDNNYETDLIMPIIEFVSRISNMSYAEAAQKEKTSLKVVGDHLRAVAHLIADGVRPSNVGRGYIVRRLIRRIVRHGRLLGIDGPFIVDVMPVVSDLAFEAGLSGVRENFDEIGKELQREEARFLDTLDRGEACLEDVLDRAREGGTNAIAGKDAFELYDTFGFPLELTEEIAAEQGYRVDKEGFEVCMEEQRKRARAARDSGALDVAENKLLQEVLETAGATEFEGYTNVAVSGAHVTALLVQGVGSVQEAKEGESVRILLDRSPFYAEGGGQVGDKGVLRGPNGTFRVDDTRKDAGAHVHIGHVTKGYIALGDTVSAVVNAVERRRIMAHHTATHLLQSALKEVIQDSSISQAGSLVDADRLRFDFSCPRPVSQHELESVEQLVNGWIAEAHDTQVSFMTLDDAKEAGAVAMFGEKYDASEVRVVDLPGVSMELCGGIHVNNTVDIGLFKIVNESGPSSGVRRIEAVCGPAVMPYLSIREKAVRELSLALKTRPEDLPSRVSSLQEELRVKSKELDAANAELAVVRAMSLDTVAEEIGGHSYIVASLGKGVTSDSLKAATERLSAKLGPKSVVLLASENEGKVAFVAAVGKSAQKKGLQAGKLVGKVAKVCSGGGGGRPNFAQAGGRDATKLNDAMALAKSAIREVIGTDLDE
eukprot:GFKZ01013918.1.p1 GENE.GFKZ01013918.1~~GFKZ01013918.1.p1  ORF type:complete len:952 (-),score=166.77 GFKZ01013918.1:2690-5545(-)